jgi:cyclophilin family peptidyl-prolyl cis-trans isomerase
MQARVFSVVLSAVALLGSSASGAGAADKLRFSGDPVVDISVAGKGTIRLEVFKKEAPISSNNFLDLIGRGFYNGLTFHRVEPGFVIQGGDPNGNGTGDFVDPETHKKRTIQLEVKPNLKHDSAGVLAMARSGNPNSASCQFYITLAPATSLDMGYAVFGHVISGQDVVDKVQIGDKMSKVWVEK